MRFLNFTIIAFFTVLACAAQSGKQLGIKISNPLSQSREAVLVVLTEQQLRKSISDFKPDQITVWLNGKEIPVQYKTGPEAGLYFVLDKLEAKEAVMLNVRFDRPRQAYAKRTQAELSHKTGGEFVNREYAGGSFKNVEYLRVPPEHKDHSWFIRYEGPGWESDKVGYRFYLDQRNATDVFGKVTDQMVLQQVGLDGFDSYHNMQPWGMDVMKVGKSLGLGSIGSLVDGKIERVEKTDSVTCRIEQNGPVYSSIETRYRGWKLADTKFNVQSLISIHAGTRLSRQQLRFDEAPENISTGIVKDKTSPLISEKGSKEKWGYLATWGKQSLNNDELGLAVFFDPGNFSTFTEDEFSHVVKLKPVQTSLQYYFLAAWVKEPGGIQNEEQFKKYVDQVALELANPVKVETVKAIK
jgi:hypothetical protein